MNPVPDDGVGRRAWTAVASWVRGSRALLSVCRVPGVVPSFESRTGMTYEAAALAGRPAVLAVVAAGPTTVGEPWIDAGTGQVHHTTWDDLLRALRIHVQVLANGALSWGISVDDEGFPVTDHDEEGETLAAVPGVRDVVRQDREEFDWVTDDARPVDEMLADFLRVVTAPPGRIVIGMNRRGDRSDRRPEEAGARPGRAGLVSAEGMTRSLGPDWRIAPDGLRERDAARVILLDDAGRVLLVRGHDVDQPERSWWFTLGGGIDAGETAVEAALREVREEAGLTLSPADLVGPVLTRTGMFDFYAETCRQHEVFFLAHLPGGHSPDRSGWTDVEREMLDEMAWLSADELRAQPREVFPHELPDVVDSLVAGWDGTTRHLGAQADD